MMFLKPETALRNMSPERNYLARLEMIASTLAETSERSELEIIPETPLSDGESGGIVLDSCDPPGDSSTPTLAIAIKESIGRGNNPSIPEYLKATIAVLANTEDVKQTEIAKEFNVAQSTVSNFANGLDNSRNPDPKLHNVVKKIDSSRQSIEDEALKKTMMTLGLLTESDVMCLGAKDKSIVANNISKVAANMRDKNVNVNDNRVQLVINSPQVRQSYHYPEVEV